MNKLIYFLPVFAVVFMSCEQDANVDVPEIDPQLVINCFITPQDSMLRAQIELSNPVFSNNLQNGPIDNATVTLYGNNTSVVLVYNSTNMYYEASASTFPIIAGNEYHIIVTNPSGLSAEAYTTVPANTPDNFTTTMEDTILTVDPWSEQGRVTFDYSFDDVSGQQNFYRIMSYLVEYSSWSVDTMYQRTGWELFSDQNADGDHIARSLTFDYYSGSSDTIVAYDIYALNCNYDYYSFHKSLDNYQGDNPFAEPTLIYSNVTNGLGIFGAANGTKLRFWR